MRLEKPEYSDLPLGTPQSLTSLDSLEDWTIETERDPVLEFYGMMTPRRKGRL